MEDMIVQDKNILNGKPIIKGTRMSVDIILELLSSGMEIKDIIKEYPYLNKKQIQTAISYAANLIKREETYIFNHSKKILYEIPS